MNRFEAPEMYESKGILHNRQVQTPCVSLVKNQGVPATGNTHLKALPGAGWLRV